MGAVEAAPGVGEQKDGQDSSRGGRGELHFSTLTVLYIISSWYLLARAKGFKNFFFRVRLFSLFYDKIGVSSRCFPSFKAVY